MNNLNEWAKKADNFKLPLWNDLPDIELYMDQVTSQLCRYFAPLQINKDELSVTASMVNNYVKQGLLPAPVKKKYSRIHLAHLVIICLLKQVFSIPDVKNLIDEMFKGLQEEQLQSVYNEFCSAQKTAYKNTAQAAISNKPEKASECSIAMQAAINACASKSMAQALLVKCDEKLNTK